MPTQLDKVLKLLSDEQWHSLTEISQNLFIRKKSVGSRIRDLRLAEHGSHQIEVRETSKPKVYEYRLVKRLSTNMTMGGMPTATHHSVVDIKSVDPDTGEFGKSPEWFNLEIPQIKFLDTQTMLTVWLPATDCAVMSFGNIQRVVAKDRCGNVVPHLITLQDTI